MLHCAARCGEVAHLMNFIEANGAIRDLLATDRLDWIQAPVQGPPADAANGSTATSHGAFDDDAATLQATLARITGARTAAGPVRLHRSEAGLADCRRQLCEALETPVRR